MVAVWAKKRFTSFARSTSRKCYIWKLLLFTVVVKLELIFYHICCGTGNFGHWQYKGTKIYDDQPVWLMVRVKPENPDLPCPDLPGPSIYRASILSPKNKLYVWINAKGTPIYRASRFTGANSFLPRGPVNRGFTIFIKFNYVLEPKLLNWCCTMTMHQIIIRRSEEFTLNCYFSTIYWYLIC